jgi:Rap1a immunity proteins
MKGPAAIAGAITALLLASPAFSNEMTTGDLQRICASSDSMDVGSCQFFIFGVSQGIGVGVSIAKAKPSVCIPPNTSISALEALVKDVINKDLTLNPQDGDLAADGFIGAVLTQNFPCKKIK